MVRVRAHAIHCTLGIDDGLLLVLDNFHLVQVAHLLIVWREPLGLERLQYLEPLQTQPYRKEPYGENYGDQAQLGNRVTMGGLVVESIDAISLVELCQIFVVPIRVLRVN